MAGLIFFLLRNHKVEKEYERKLSESLKDEYIIDPETGVKLTLEEAESGHWITHDNEFQPIPDSAIEEQISEGQKILGRGLNYLITSKEYKRSMLSEAQIDFLNHTHTLKKYDNWTYSSAFSFEKGIVLYLAPEIYGRTYFDEDYSESQVMFWKKIENIKGHYYLREKSNIEKVLDKFRNDDCLQLKDYESFTLLKSSKFLKLQRILESFENQKGLEIEFYNDNLLVKTLKLANREDIIRIEGIIKNIG